MRIAKYYKALKLLYRSISHVVDMKEFQSLEQFLQDCGSIQRGQSSQSLDLGCGGKPRNPFQASSLWGVDIAPGTQSQIVQADLTQDPIPFNDSSMDFITAFDFIEHIPRVVYLPSVRYPFIELMNEIHRVLKPDGFFLSHTPVFPFSACFTDPTHVNLITSETFSLYFDDERQWGRMYGFHGSFTMVNQALVGTHLLSLMQKRSWIWVTDC